MEEFKKVFPIIKKDINDELTEMKLPSFILDWVNKLLDYNIFGGKMIRGLALVNSYKILIDDDSDSNNNEDKDDDDEVLFKSKILGCCIEIIHSSFLIDDDIIDNGIKRRGIDCWYKTNDPLNSEFKVGLIAVNDAGLLESSIYFLLKKYFSMESYYSLMLDTFNESTFKARCGQLLDTTFAHCKRGDFSKFTLENFETTANYKSSYYTFYLPVKLSIILSKSNKTQKDDDDDDDDDDEYYNEESLNSIKEICYDLGIYGQAQDDYLDCYGDSNIIGKVGTDIEENKCCWLICKALSLANNEQIELLKKHYGIYNDNDVSIVKSIYKQLEIEYHYKQYEETMYQLISSKINNNDKIKSKKIKKLLFILLNKLYKRNK